jgi:nucleoside diphosphate kinase
MLGSEPAGVFALAVLKPDAVHQNLEFEIGSFLRARGFQIVMAKRRYVSPEVRYSLYRPDVTKWTTNWTLGGVLYTLGPALVMLLRNDQVPSEYDSASDFLSRGLKGHHDPLEAAPGTIRGEFNSVNRALNLVHASDDSANLIRELPILVDSLGGAYLAYMTLSTEPCNEAEHKPRLLDFTGQILRVHEWLIVEHGQDVGLRAAARYLLDDCRIRLAAIAGRSARQSILASTLDGVHRLVSRRQDEPGRLASELSGRTRLADLDYPSLFRRLAAAGLVLDAWNQFLLHTSLYYLDPKTSAPD